MMKKLFQRNVKNDGDDHFINKMMMMVMVVVVVVVVEVVHQRTKPRLYITIQSRQTANYLSC